MSLRSNRLFIIVIIAVVLGVVSCRHEPFNDQPIDPSALDSIVYFEGLPEQNCDSIDTSYNAYNTDHWTYKFEVDIDGNGEADFDFRHRGMSGVTSSGFGWEYFSRAMRECQAKARGYQFGMIPEDREDQETINEDINWMDWSSTVNLLFQDHTQSVPDTAAFAKQEFIPVRFEKDSEFYYGWVKLGGEHSYYCCGMHLEGGAVNFKKNRPIRKGQQE